MTFTQLLHTVQTVIFDSRPSLLTNSLFNGSQLKPRIMMLINPKTRRYLVWKYTLMFPLLAVLAGLTAAREPVAEMLLGQPGGKITVSGQVVDAEGKPVPKATVLTAGGTKRTSTNETGRFRLTDVAPGAQLTVSSPGFETAAIELKGRKVIEVTLKPRPQMLGEILVVGYQTDPGSAPSTRDNIFTVVEQNPEFAGGMDGLGRYLVRSLRYPAEAQRRNVQGTVFVRFIVGSEGNVGGLRVQKGIGSGCDEEAIRVVSQMPKWTPGRQAGKPVNVEYVLPIQFALEKPTGDKRTGQLNQQRVPPSTRATSNGHASDVALTDELRFDRSDSITPGSRLKSNFTKTSENINFILDGRQVTWSASPPVFVIDGVISTSADGLSGIDTKQISSIEVLKDKSAVSIYGEKVRNGVVMVTTKSGKP